jgi:UDP-glucose 4-epimerase
MRPFMEGADCVFHLAAFPRVQPSIDDPLFANDINLNGTLNVLKCAVDSGVRKVIFSSSSSIYGDKGEVALTEGMEPHPISPYALQKYAGEMYCRLFSEIYNLETVCLRYFNVYGKRMPLEGAYTLVLGVFETQIRNKQPLTITNDGNQRRDMTNVHDVVRANIMAYESQVRNGEGINIGSGENHSINEIAEVIGGPTVNIGPRIEPRTSLADISLAKKLLGWEPTVDFNKWLVEWRNAI